VNFDAVVLAGGKGTRLAPFTHVLPKPLLPVDQRPILDHVLTRLAAEGCGRVTLALGHLGHLIETYCSDGRRWSLEIDYFREEHPLGTVGALALLDLPTSPFIVMNGDVLSDVSYHVLFDAHSTAGAELTISSFRRTVCDEFGVIDRAPEGQVVAYEEKPHHEYLVSMGIYVLDPSVVDLVRAGDPMDFPDLVQAMLGAGRAVHSHVHSGYWLDLGRPDDFARANEEFEHVRARLGL